MRRPVIFILAIGFAAALIASLAQALGWLLFLELPIAHLLVSGGNLTSVAAGWHYLIIVAVVFATAWLTIVSRGETRVLWLLLAVIAELFALMWVCSLYRSLFQPLPPLLAMLLSFAAASVYLRVTQRISAALPIAIFSGKVSEEKLRQFRTGELEFQSNAASFETTVLVCDMADKYELADTADPGAVAAACEKFSRRATEFLLKAGAYLHAADGEGVVAVFGFPAASERTAEKAIGAAFDLARIFENDPAGSNGETAPALGVHIGISSGTVVSAPMGERPDLFIMGEPLELARRFCMANRFYGTRILIGPRTFELANEAVIARPIDFLSGVTPQERHEIYEPLALSAEAPSELIARRDCFWNGIVFYREQRWAEAYAEFQKARNPDGEEDAPLNLYLRRLEPLALHSMESAGE